MKIRYAIFPKPINTAEGLVSAGSPIDAERHKVEMWWDTKTDTVYAREPNDVEAWQFHRAIVEGLKPYPDAGGKAK